MAAGSAGAPSTGSCGRCTDRNSLSTMHETDLHLEPNEASDLCPIEAPDLLARRGWDRALAGIELIERGPPVAPPRGRNGSVA